MSGDVQPRKRKDKRKRKAQLEALQQEEYREEKAFLQSDLSVEEEQPYLLKEESWEDSGAEQSEKSDIYIPHDDHHHDDGSIVAKIVFFLLFGLLVIVAVLIVTEYQGTKEVDIPVSESQFSTWLEGWVDESPPDHDDHHEAVEDEHDDEDEHGDEHEEDDEHDDDDDEGIGSEDEHDEESMEMPASVQINLLITKLSKLSANPKKTVKAQALSKRLETILMDIYTGNNDPALFEQIAKVREEIVKLGGKKKSKSLVHEEVPLADLGLKPKAPPPPPEEPSAEQDEASEEVYQPPPRKLQAPPPQTQAPPLPRQAPPPTRQTPPTPDPPMRRVVQPVSEEEDDEPLSQEEDSGAVQDDDDLEPSAEDEPLSEEEEEPPLSEEEEKEPPVSEEEDPPSEEYENDDITNGDDYLIRDELDQADQIGEASPEHALSRFQSILKRHPASPRARYGHAKAVDRVSEKERSNSKLEEAITAYQKVLELGKNVPDKLYSLAAQRCIDRIRFRGSHAKAITIQQSLVSRFPTEPMYLNEIAVSYLLLGQTKEAKVTLENVLKKWPNNGFAKAHYGFILKTVDLQLEKAVKYLSEGISSRETGTIDGRFFFQLGDALARLGKQEEALQVYENGVKEGLFLSKYQRSLYNVDRLKGQPWWTPRETTYSKQFNELRRNWQLIRDEGKALLNEKGLFQDESENLREKGDWKQFELFARGQRVAKACQRAPKTCSFIENFTEARSCTRGQIKFSVMLPGTHVWAHTGPTNCRLRAHLGLIVPDGPRIRVANETRTWKEGAFIIFDDSFEHEVWHDGKEVRLVLIIDVWHPELTENERLTLPAI